VRRIPLAAFPETRHDPSIETRNPETNMTLTAARAAIRNFKAIVEARPLTKAERQALLNARARVRTLTGNHFAA
jgi:hypothetical protein